MPKGKPKSIAEAIDEVRSKAEAQANLLESIGKELHVVATQTLTRHVRDFIDKVFDADERAAKKAGKKPAKIAAKPRRKKPAQKKSATQKAATGSL